MAVIGLGDLVTWRHFVRASWGQLSFLLLEWRPMMVPRGDLALVLGILWMSLVGEPSNNLRRQGAGLLVVVLWLWD